ncbi:uncharacterized protein LOC120761150 isoform X2 [Hirundo rustica]|uniref:uncharacterized protein LOC120761150 isoform X2 n=1 Tax=Hirundo rustica TaxID=43150 RepID=UPI001A940FE3|nr:uncharacterized protein LOC120761150 isoform X2 [Hirundo rustica]
MCQDGFKQGSYVLGWIQTGILGSRMDSSRDPGLQDGFKQGSCVPGWIQAGIPGSRMDSSRDPGFQDGFKQGSCVPGWIQAGILCSRMDSSRDPGFQDGFKQGSRVPGWIQAGIPGLAGMDSSRDPRFQDGFKQGSQVPGWIQAGIPGSRMDSSRDPGLQDGFKQGSRVPGWIQAGIPGSRIGGSEGVASAPWGRGHQHGQRLCPAGFWRSWREFLLGSPGEDPGPDRAQERRSSPPPGSSRARVRPWTLPLRWDPQPGFGMGFGCSLLSAAGNGTAGRLLLPNPVDLLLLASSCCRRLRHREIPEGHTWKSSTHSLRLQLPLFLGYSEHPGSGEGFPALLEDKSCCSEASPAILCLRPCPARSS